VCDRLVLGVFSGEIYLGNACFGGGKRNEDIQSVNILARATCPIHMSDKTLSIKKVNISDARTNVMKNWSNQGFLLASLKTS
jgi:hypothetical protein